MASNGDFPHGDQLQTVSRDAVSEVQHQPGLSHGADQAHRQDAGAESGTGDRQGAGNLEQGAGGLHAAGGDAGAVAGTVSGKPAKTQEEAPPRLIIPSADFGGPIYSLFDENAWLGDERPFDLDEDNDLPWKRGDADIAIKNLGELLVRVAVRDGHAYFWPRQTYADTVSAARWIDILNAAIGDLIRLRRYFEQETLTAGGAQ